MRSFPPWLALLYLHRQTALQPALFFQLCVAGRSVAALELCPWRVFGGSMDIACFPGAGWIEATLDCLRSDELRCG